jgi:hypothetical protein
MLLKIFQIIERQGMLPNTFHVVSITLISKTGQKQNRKETYKIITLMNIDTKTFNKIFATKFNNILKTSYMVIKLVSFWLRFNTCKLTNVI